MTRSANWPDASVTSVANGSDSNPPQTAAPGIGRPDASMTHPVMAPVFRDGFSAGGVFNGLTPAFCCVASTPAPGTSLKAPGADVAGGADGRRMLIVRKINARLEAPRVK